MRLANRVREIRMLRGVTITALQKASGVSRTTIHAIEGDPTYVPSTATLVALAHALNDDHLFWLERTGDEGSL